MRQHPDPNDFHEDLDHYGDSNEEDLEELARRSIRAAACRSGR
jgi:hypothetical protein